MKSSSNKLSSPIAIYSQYEHKDSQMQETILYTEDQVMQYLEDIMNKKKFFGHNCNDFDSEESIIWHVSYDHDADEDARHFTDDVFNAVLGFNECKDRVSKQEILNKIRQMKEKQHEHGKIISEREKTRGLQKQGIP